MPANTGIYHYPGFKRSHPGKQSIKGMNQWTAKITLIKQEWQGGVEEQEKMKNRECDGFTSTQEKIHGAIVNEGLSRIWETQLSRRVNVIKCSLTSPPQYVKEFYHF